MLASHSQARPDLTSVITPPAIIPWAVPASTLIYDNNKGNEEVTFFRRCDNQQNKSQSVNQAKSAKTRT